MKDHTTDPVVRKSAGHLLRCGLKAIGSRTLPTDSYRGHDLAFRTIPRHGGLSRNYRAARSGYVPTWTACIGCGCNSCGAQRSERSLKEPAP